MKLRLTAFSLAAGLAALTALAQDTPPPAPPAPPPPATPAPAPGTPPGLLPPAQGIPVEEPDSFKSEKERQSYAVGWLFANREKSNAASSGAPTPGTDEVVAGMKDVLDGGKSVDYAIGAMLAMQIKRAEVDVDIETLIAAVRDSFAGQTGKLNAQQQQMVLQRVQNDVRTRIEARQKAEQAKALKAATDFLTENAKTEGVKATPSGLQYKVEKEGDGKNATEADIVTVNYRATLADGSEIEKNPPTGPARKTVRTLPKGIQEGLTILKAGGKGKFWVPPALGYGENGRPPLVKANAVLVYDIEVLSVEPLPKPPPANTTTPQPGRGPVTAVTPPITVEIPPKPGEKPATPPPPTPAPPPAPVPPPPAPNK
jgi:FKBP-type peptidyl-prolyl cis-trans isomerase